MKNNLNVEILAKGLRAIEYLIQESHGIYGLHLNGDLSPWEDFSSEGYSKEWLADYRKAIDYLNSENIL